jgi:hypothetical protein
LLEVWSILSGATVICGTGVGDGGGGGCVGVQVQDTVRGFAPPDPVKVKVPC